MVKLIERIGRLAAPDLVAAGEEVALNIVAEAAQIHELEQGAFAIALRLAISATRLVLKSGMTLVQGRRRP